MYFIVGEFIKICGPFGRTLYYPSVGTFIGEIILILVLFAPFFVLCYYFNNLNKILLRDWCKKYGKLAEEELQVPIEISEGTNLTLQLG